MKILSIAGCNLNSLRVDFKVDFTTGVLKDCGIFAITGPTGAGKTTLLDTITLALYGKTPRSAKDDDIISYGAGEARAEVIFQTSEGCFKSEWKVRRSRSKHDGAIQQSSMELSTYPEGKILTQKKREAQDKIKELIKLDYGQFLKSVLLAQGAFKAFLDADERERGEMLEKISDTSLYTTLSKKAFERKRTEEQALEMLYAQIGNVVLLSDEERLFNVNLIGNLTVELAELQTDLDQHQKKFNWLTNINELTRKKIEAENEVENAKARLEQERPNLIRWEAHLLVADLELQWTQYLSKSKDIDAQHQNIKKLEEKIAALSLKSKEAEALQIMALEQLEDAVKNRQEKMPVILGAITRQKDLLSEKTQLSSLREKYKARLLEGTDCKSKLSTNETNLINDKKILKDLEMWITEHQQYVHAGDSYTQASLLANQLKRSKADIELLKAAIAKATEQILVAKNDILTAEKSERQAASDQQLLKHTWDKTLEELGKLKGQLVIQTEVNKQELETTSAWADEQQNVLSRQEFLAEHLSRLHEGESCPLCGSTEHPNQTLSITDVQDEIRKIKVLLKQYQNIIKSNRAKQKTIDGILANLEEINEAGDQLSELTQQNFEEVFKELIQEQRSVPQRQHSALLMHTSATERKQSLTEKIVDLEGRKNDTIKNLEMANGNLSSQLKDLEEIAALFHLEFDPGNPSGLADSLKKYSEEFSNKTKEESGLRKTIPGIEERIEMLQTQIVRLRKDLSDLNKEIDTKNIKIQEYTSEISAAHTGYNSPEEARDHLAGAEKSAADRLTQSNLLLGKLQNEEVKTNGEKENSFVHLLHLQQATESLVNDLKTGLASAALEEDISLVERNLLIGNERLLLGRLHKSVHEKLYVAEAQSESCNKQLEQQQSLNLTDEEQDVIAVDMQHVGEAIQDTNRELGRLGQILKEDDARQAKIQSVKKEIEKQQNVLERWNALSHLIGSADGKKFNQFAQGLTLDRLIVTSNHHLQLLNNRYLLKRNINLYGLGLRIIDQYQADNEREINTLSGGESFLVSLALALGLSEMTSKLTTIDSLFIDEGFGTLDAETLEVALNALRGLQIGGKTIGIISHVERLKEEIYTQVEITKGADGFSTLRVIPELD